MSRPLTTIDRRGLARISTPDGAIFVVAADQRNSMRALMDEDASRVTAADLYAAKADIASILGEAAPGILFDSEVSLPGVIDDGSLPVRCAAVAGLDASGYDTDGDLRRTRFVEGMDPGKARRMGADVVKMLDYVRADREGPESFVGRRLRDLQAACDDEGILLIAEFLTYRLPEESEDDYRARFPELVAGAAAFGAACGAKLLKIPYPGSAAGCARVTSAADGVPWAVLSAGAGFEKYLEQVRTARENGAAGAVGGRAIWKDAVPLDQTERRRLLREKALPRVRALAAALA